MGVGVSAPLPRNDGVSTETLRRRWLHRYAAVQAKTDKELRSVLTQAAEDASLRIQALEKRPTFSAGVRTAQIRMAYNETSETVKEVFGSSLKIITKGRGDEAEAAVDGLSDTDRAYLRAVFSTKDGVDRFLAAQRQAARLGVANAITTVTKSDTPLSTRVYRTRSLANNWVKRLITASVIRGDSAQDIAKAVRSHIRPDVPGGVSYAALRLGRTELNNAFHATSVVLAEDRPWIESMRWNLSKTHTWEGTRDRPVEICERYAAQIFTPATVPRKPHPQCRCFVSPEVEDFSTFMAHLTAGQYDNWQRSNRAA